MAGTISALAAFAMFGFASMGRARGAGPRAGYVLVPLSLLVLLAIISTSHSVSRLDHRVLLSLLTAAHHVGAAIWLGALPFLLLSMREAVEPDGAKRMLRRFSPMALTGAGLLLLGGFGMAWFYMGVSRDGSLAGSIRHRLRPDDGGQDLFGCVDHGAWARGISSWYGASRRPRSRC